MSEPALPKPPGKLAKIFAPLTAAPGRLLRLSLPTKAALVTFFALTIIAVWALLAFHANPASVPWRHAISWGWVLAVLCLIVLIPLVLHRALKLWLEGEPSRFPDIDFAWQAGLDALSKSGIDLSSAPLFLILGANGEVQERSIMNAAGLPLRVRETPEGPAPLHWYANPDGVYLFVGEASWLGALARLYSKRKTQLVAETLPNLEGPEQRAALPPAGEGPEPLAVPAGASAAAASAPPASAAARSQDTRGTIMLDQYMAGAMAAAAPRADSGAVYGGSAADVQAAIAREGATPHRGTIMLQAPMADLARAAAAAPGGSAASSHSASAPPPVRLQPAILPAQDSTEQLQRLRHLCQLLKRARQPLCAANGVLALLQFELVQAGPREAEELQRAAHADLSAVQQGLGLQCPVTAMVAGLESESGFRELVRRVGRDRAGVQRFGQRYDLRAIATPEEMTSLCAHVCGAFEDWVYALFREQGALSRPGNTRLYGLMCKVRNNLKSRLASVLAAGFGQDPVARASADPFLFSGCYFAATGDTEDRQAFVAGVFQKLIEEQEQVEWTRQTAASDRRLLRLALTGLTLDALLLFGLAGLVIFRLVR